jgi:hypothetical protein
MPDTQPDSPYWQRRDITEQVFEAQGLVRGASIDVPRGQHWHIKGGITFAIQWLGENLDYVDSEVVSHILRGAAEWRAKNPPTYC